METSYIAFISYRHQPLDQAVAKKLHRLIEHFHVPKELRRDGSKRLGRVFRDEDELPLSTDLGESIHYALGHSEYLIAICTPEYQKSRWCMEELNSFIASHGRDHVLAVLAAGAPEESFPPQLLTDTDADGNIRAVEPLAANIAAPTNAKRMKRLKTEHLRLAAAMLGCSYDSLYQRERRYRQRRIIAASAAALAVAGMFIGTLINKNAQIQARYEEAQTNYHMAQTNLELAEANLRLAQYNESVSLTENARNDLALGRRSDAVRTLLKAIPDSGNQPYDRTADGELISALGVYEDEGFRFISNIRQSSDINSWVLSDDGKILFTRDKFSCVRAWSAETGNPLWQTTLSCKTIYSNDMIWCGNPRGVICSGYSGELVLLSAEDGREIWSQYAGGDSPAMLLRKKAGEAVCLTISQNQILIRYIDLKTGELKRELESSLSFSPLNNGNFRISANGRYAATVIDSYRNGGISDWFGILINLETGDTREYELVSGTITETSIAFTFLPDSTLLLSGGFKNDTSLTLTLQKIQPESGEVAYSTSLQTEPPDTLVPSHLLAGSPEYAILVYERMVYEFDVSDGKLLQKASMPGNIISIERANRSTDVFICSFSSGLVTFLVHVKLASDWNLYNTECGFQISRSRIDPSTETLTLIPRNRANEMLLIRQINSSAAVFKSDTVYKEAMPFPSGNNILMFDSGRSSMAVLFSASDRIKQEVQLSRRLPPNDSIVFSADEKALYCNTYIVQIADGAVSELSVPFEKFERADAAFVPAAGKAVTAVLLADSEYVGPEADENASAEEALIMFLENIDNMVDIPYFNIFVEGKGRGRIALPEGIALSYDKDANIFRLDGCGLLLVSGNPDSTLVAYDVTADTWRTWNTESTVVQAASGNLNKVTALLSGYSLCLADFETGTILWKAETGIIPDLVSGLWFSPDDRLLLMVYGGTRASVYRVADGQLLNDIPFVSHPEYSRISIQQDDSGLLYIYNPFSVKAGSDSLILDGATGELLGRIPGLMFVNFRTGKVYRFGKYNGRNDQTLICPLYTREKLLELAEPFR